MNAVLTDLVKTVAIKDISKLNVLHCAASVTLAGVREPKNSTPKTNFDPDKFINKYTNRMGKWIGKITSAVKGNKLTVTVKTFLKKEKHKQ